MALLLAIGIIALVLLRNGTNNDTAKATTEVTTEETTEKTTEAMTEATTEATTEVTTEATTENPAELEYNEACELFDEGKYYSAKKAFESSQFGDWEERAAQCFQTAPETGEIFHDDKYLTSLDEGYEWKITINTSVDGGQGVESEETDWDSWD